MLYFMDFFGKKNLSHLFAVFNWTILEVIAESDIDNMFNIQGDL